MNTFTIDTHNHVARHDPGSEIPDASAAFSSEADLATLSERWPVTRLVNIWNALPGVQPVRKFTDRKTAVRRIWAALDQSAPASPEQKSRKTQTVSKPKRAPEKPAWQDLPAPTANATYENGFVVDPE